MLEDVHAKRGVEFRAVALDPNEQRREKMLSMVETIYGGRLPKNIAVANLDDGQTIINDWTGSLGCNAVLEVFEPGFFEVAASKRCD